MFQRVPKCSKVFQSVPKCSKVLGGRTNVSSNFVSHSSDCLTERPIEIQHQQRFVTFDRPYHGNILAIHHTLQNGLCKISPIDSRTNATISKTKWLPPHESTECVTDLEYQIELLIFESILTSFKLSIIFGGSWGNNKNRLEPKTEPPLGNLACPNL